LFDTVPAGSGVKKENGYERNETIGEEHDTGTSPAGVHEGDGELPACRGEENRAQRSVGGPASASQEAGPDTGADGASGGGAKAVLGVGEPWRRVATVSAAMTHLLRIYRTESGQWSGIVLKDGAEVTRIDDCKSPGEVVDAAKEIWPGIEVEPSEAERAFWATFKNQPNTDL